MSPEETFHEEASELLGELEAALLELEKNTDDVESFDLAFRAMHTIKGSASMFGRERLAAFTHHLESAYEQVRAGRISIDKTLISISLKSIDYIDQLLNDVDAASVGPELDADGQSLVDQLYEAFPQIASDQGDSQAGAQPSALETANDTDADIGVYFVRLKPCADAYATGMNPLPLIRELQQLATVFKITTLSHDVPTLEELDPEENRLSWDIVFSVASSDIGAEDIRDVFAFVEDDWDITIKRVDDQTEAELEKRLGEILIERGDATSEDVSTALAAMKKTGELLIQNGVSAGAVQSALQEQSVVRQTHEERRKSNASTNVKVPAERLDVLMDLVGELVIAQARLNQSADRIIDTELTAVSESIERLTTELRDNTLGLRMLPIGTTFARFRRLVRDLSDELGKEIDLITEGAETELDKTVIDRLADPLVHLIRNSIDHGIEAPDVRTSKGKSAHGTVVLSAIHSESHVVIKINDDGAGLNKESIRSKALSKGLINEDTVLSDTELFNLIFEAGFSTAEKISNISGRGVGMDVVKRSIEQLRGKVWIESEVDRGTTIVIELPLTLAIIEGLLVQVGDEKYVIPLSIVEECIELEQNASIQKKGGNRLIEVRGEFVPYLSLRDWFGVTDGMPYIQQIVVIRMGDSRFGLTVDQVIGQHQTVIKALGRLYEGVKGLSGATILGDGAVALIIDTAKLVDAMQAEHLQLLEESTQSFERAS